MDDDGLHKGLRRPNGVWGLRQRARRDESRPVVQGSRRPARMRVAAHFHPIIVSMSFSLLGSVSDILVAGCELGQRGAFRVSPLLAHTIVEPK